MYSVLCIAFEGIGLQPALSLGWRAIGVSFNVRISFSYRIKKQKKKYDYPLTNAQIVVYCYIKSKEPQKKKDHGNEC